MLRKYSTGMPPSIARLTPSSGHSRCARSVVHTQMVTRMTAIVTRTNPWIGRATKLPSSAAAGTAAGDGRTSHSVASSDWPLVSCGTRMSSTRSVMIAKKPSDRTWKLDGIRT